MSELNRAQRDDCVTLITIHSAKGTEAPVCYIPGVSPGAYPLARCIGDLDEVEEERRVLYVAVTRAQSELILTRQQHSRHAAQPPPADDGELMVTYFLNDLPEQLVDTATSARRRQAEFIETFRRPMPDVGIDLR